MSRISLCLSNALVIALQRFFYLGVFRTYLLKIGNLLKKKKTQWNLHYFQELRTEILRVQEIFWKFNLLHLMGKVKLSYQYNYLYNYYYYWIFNIIIVYKVYKVLSYYWIGFKLNMFSSQHALRIWWLPRRQDSGPLWVNFFITFLIIWNEIIFV